MPPPPSRARAREKKNLRENAPISERAYVWELIEQLALINKISTDCKDIFSIRLEHISEKPSAGDQRAWRKSSPGELTSIGFLLRRKSSQNFPRIPRTSRFWGGWVGVQALSFSRVQSSVSSNVKAACVSCYRSRTHEKVAIDENVFVKCVSAFRRRLWDYARVTEPEACAFEMVGGWEKSGEKPWTRISYNAHSANDDEGYSWLGRYVAKEVSSCESNEKILLFLCFLRFVYLLLK